MNMIVTAPIKVVYPSAYREIALSGVYEISKVLTAPQPRELMIAGVISILSSFMQMRRGMILLLDEAGDPEMAAATGADSDRPMRSKSLVPQRAIDQIVATAVPLVVDNIAGHLLFTGSAYLHLAPPRIKTSFIAVPIKVDAKVKGVLSIDREWNGKHEFCLDDDVRFLTVIANMVGQSVHMQNLVACDRDRLILHAHRLEKQLVEAREAAPTSGGAPKRIPVKAKGIVGESPVMRRLLDQVALAGRSNATVLLRGETGTGKELFARAVHDHSPRDKGPFVKVNCAALPESVIESELFGHEKGSFTGAISQRLGRFELAHNGTLFLDEIGEISASFQAKLLRVLQEGEFERVGGAKTLKVDVRIVCATNRNLEDAVSKGEFRADLYYRINVVTLVLPPLRDRPGDIPDLAELFLQRFSAENVRQMQFSKSAIDVVSKCAFPGNVRELENCVRRTATLAGDDVIEAGDFACQQGSCLSSTLWKGHATPLAGLTPAQTAPVAPPIQPDPEPEPIPVAAEQENSLRCPSPDACPMGNPSQFEREKLIAAMERSGWVQAKAGRLLGLTPRQIGYALRKHDIDVTKF
jgi:Nif-specific regulatory protein